MFHKHKFKKEGNNLWCECGKTKRLACDHNWIVHDESNIKNWNSSQTVQTLRCETCGALKYINLTTGY